MKTLPIDMNAASRVLTRPNLDREQHAATSRTVNRDEWRSSSPSEEISVVLRGGASRHTCCNAPNLRQSSELSLLHDLIETVKLDPENIS